jgi:hypothetical protein
MPTWRAEIDVIANHEEDASECWETARLAATLEIAAENIIEAAKWFHCLAASIASNPRVADATVTSIMRVKP